MQKADDTKSITFSYGSTSYTFNPAEGSSFDKLQYKFDIGDANDYDKDSITMKLTTSALGEAASMLSYDQSTTTLSFVNL